MSKSKIAWIDKKDLSPFIDHDRMADLLGVQRIGDWDMSVDWQFDYDPENPDEHDTERDEAWQNYTNALESVFEELLEHHGLTLQKHKGEWLFRVVPKKDWKDAATEIAKTVNGVGFFYFRSIRDFLDSGPYTPRAAVLTHLHWVKHWPDVYEGTKASTMFDRRRR